MVRRLVLASVLLGSGWATWRYFHRPKQAVYETTLVSKGDLQSIVTATGSVVPIRTVGVGAQISGVITKLYVDYESKVKQGQLLAEIDPRPLQDTVASAKADLAQARAAVTAAEASLKAANDAITAARQDADRNKALLKQFTSVEQHYQLEFDRQKALGPIASADDLATAKETRDVALQDELSASAQEQISESTIDEKIAERDAAQYQVEAAKGQLGQAQAALAQAEVNLQRTKITSPIDGTVLVVDVAVGQTVAASMQVPELFQIAEDLSKMQLDVQLDESDVSRVQVGNPATFMVDAFPRQTFRAEVQQIRKAATNVNNVISYDVILKLDPVNVQFLPGMTANIHIISTEHKDVLKVSNAATRFRPLEGKVPSGSNLWIRDEKGQPRAVAVTIGITDGRETEVSSPQIHEGDSVIVAEQ